MSERQPTEQEALHAVQDILFGDSAAHRQHVSSDPIERLRELAEERRAIAREREAIKREREALGADPLAGEREALRGAREAYQRAVEALGG